MESNYNSDNFERLLRESSDQYRMYPSESAWKNIYRALHTRRKWFGLGFLLLMLSAGFVTTIMLSDSTSTSKQTIAGTTSATVPVVSNEQTQPGKQEDAVSITPLYKNNFPESVNPASSSPLIQDVFIRTNPLEEAVIILPTENEFVKTEPGNAIEVEKTTEASTGNPENQIATFVPINVNLIDEATDQNLFFTLNKIDDRKQAPGTIAKRTISYPLSIESVINSYVKRHKKLSFQYYFTPTISYRKLSENKSYLKSLAYNPNNTAMYYDVNKVVTHKPDMGIEAGVAARYAINKRTKLRAGLQFNTSRYDIKAYRSATELTTIALNTGSVVADSLNTLSSYRNFNGYKSDWLHNLYFQVAAPIGIEYQVAGDNRVKFGVAGTIQPTYVIGDRVYMISTNYKNYAEVPSLIRRWNVNTSFEAFVGYTTGRMNWQVGPQVRYQLMSSFVKEYPVKENLFDFGLKIGVSVNR